MIGLPQFTGIGYRKQGGLMEKENGVPIKATRVFSNPLQANDPFEDPTFDVDLSDHKFDYSLDALWIILGVPDLCGFRLVGAKFQKCRDFGINIRRDFICTELICKKGVVPVYITGDNTNLYITRPDISDADLAKLQANNIDIKTDFSVSIAWVFRSKFNIMCHRIINDALSKEERNERKSDTEFIDK